MERLGPEMVQCIKSLCALSYHEVFLIRLEKLNNSWDKDIWSFLQLGNLCRCLKIGVKAGLDDALVIIMNASSCRDKGS